MDQRTRPGPAAGDVHPRVGALPPGRPRGGPRGVRAHPRRGAARGPRVVGLRGRRARDGRDHRVRDGGVGPRAAGSPTTAPTSACRRGPRRASTRPANVVLAARGLISADALLSGTRHWWPEEGRIAVQAGAAALDVLGRDGDVDGDVGPAHRGRRVPARPLGSWPGRRRGALRRPRGGPPRHGGAHRAPGASQRAARATPTGCATRRRSSSERGPCCTHRASRAGPGWPGSGPSTSGPAGLPATTCPSRGWRHAGTRSSRCSRSRASRTRWRAAGGASRRCCWPRVTARPTRCCAAARESARALGAAPLARRPRPAGSTPPSAPPPR